MAQKTSRPKELKNIGYEMFIGALSLLSILNLFLQVTSSGTTRTCSTWSSS